MRIVRCYGLRWVVQDQSNPPTEAHWSLLEGVRYPTRASKILTLFQLPGLRFLLVRINYKHSGYAAQSFARLRTRGHIIRTRSLIEGSMPRGNEAVGQASLSCFCWGRICVCVCVFFVGVEYCLEYLRSEFEVGALFCKGSIYVGGVEGSEFVASSVLAAQLRDGLNPGPDSFQVTIFKRSWGSSREWWIQLVSNM